MIRVRLIRRATLVTTVQRQRSADSPPREPPPPVFEGVLGVLGADREPRPARSLDEGFQYDRPVVVILDEPSDSGRRRWIQTSDLRYVVVRDRPGDEFWPARVETQRSEYTVQVLEPGTEP